MSLLREPYPPEGIETVFALLTECGPLSVRGVMTQLDLRGITFSQAHIYTVTACLVNEGRAIPSRRSGLANNPTVYQAQGPRTMSHVVPSAP